MTLRFRLPISLVLVLSLFSSEVVRGEEGYQPDPLPNPAAVVPEKLKDLPVPPNSATPEVTFADQYGPFVLVGRNAEADDSKSLFDLRTGKAVGSVKGKLNATTPFALSPDGKSLAGYASDSIAVFDLGEETRLRRELRTEKRPDQIRFLTKDHLVAYYDFENRFVLWDAVAGKLIKSCRVDQFREGGYAFSPGGKYVAYGKDQQIHVYDLALGEQIDEFDYPGGDNFSFRCEGLAFSPDGKSLAALMKEPKNHQLVIWNLEKRKVRLSISVGVLKNQTPGVSTVQWSPDGRAIMMQSEIVCDAESGKVVWKMPSVRLALGSSARLISAAQAALVQSKSDRDYAITSVGVTLEQFGAMVASVRSGGEATDVLMPKLTEADYSSAKTIDLPLNDVAWTYKPEAVGDGSGLAKRPFALQVKPNEIEAIHFTPPDPGMVFVELKTPGQPGESKKTIGFETYSLTTGRRLGRGDFNYPARLAAVSSDGKRVALAETEKGDRVDVFSADKMESIASFKPYSKEGGKKEKVAMTRFIGEKLLTISESGKVVLWTLPSCKAETVLEATGLSNWKESATGKYLAASDQSSIRIIDTATLRVVGDLPLPDPDVARKETKGLAFDPTGKFLVALMHLTDRDNGQRWAAYRFDLGTGKRSNEANFRANLNSTQPRLALETAGRDYLLIDNTALLDWDDQEVVWYYRGQTPELKYGSNRPDGRHWYTAGDAFNKTEAFLVSATIPETAVVGFVEKIQGSNDAILKPGSTVAVEIAFQGEPENVRQSAHDSATNALKAMGMKIGSGGVTLRFIGTEKPTGERVEFRNMFPAFGERPFGRTIVPLAEVEAQAQLLLEKKVIWQNSSKHGMRTFGMLTMPKGETDVNKVLRDRMWNGVASWANGVVPPKYIVNTAEGVLALPGTSVFRPEGVQTQTPKLSK